MKRGRLSKEEQANRIRQLLSFIFIFRYATREQLDMFIKSTSGVLRPKRIIETSLSRGYIKRYYKSRLKRYIYHLSDEGKGLLHRHEPYIEYYKFNSRYATLNTFEHHNFLIEVFFMLRARLEIKEWTSEWVLRKDSSKWEKFPDGQITLPSGLKIAIEAENSYKNVSDWKDFIYRYSHDIERKPRYDAVFIIPLNKDYLTGIIVKLFNFAPDFAASRFIFTDIEMLKRDECFYGNEIYPLKDVFSLLEKRYLKQ